MNQFPSFTSLIDTFAISIARDLAHELFASIPSYSPPFLRAGNSNVPHISPRFHPFGKRADRHMRHRECIFVRRATQRDSRDSGISLYSFSLVGGQVLNFRAYPHEYFTGRTRRGINLSCARHRCVSVGSRRLCKRKEQKTGE